MRRITITTNDENGDLEITGEGSGFYPNEVTLILKEAAARIERVEYMQAIQKQLEGAQSRIIVPES